MFPINFKQHQPTLHNNDTPVPTVIVSFQIAIPGQVLKKPSAPTRTRSSTLHRRRHFLNFNFPRGCLLLLSALYLAPAWNGTCQSCIWCLSDFASVVLTIILFGKQSHHFPRVFVVLPDGPRRPIFPQHFVFDQNPHQCIELLTPRVPKSNNLVPLDKRATRARALFQLYGAGRLEPCWPQHGSFR